MKPRHFTLHVAAQADLADAWQLVALNDGTERADAVYARMEAFCRSLGEFAEIGTRHDHRLPGLRSVGIPSLRRATVLFRVTADTVTVLRIGYLGRNVWDHLPD
jgi:plasmid stabilization system protein ParE